MTAIYIDSPEIVELARVAQGRATNGRMGDRALQKILQMKDSDIRVQVSRRLSKFPTLEWDNLYSSAIEGIIRALDRFDPTKGKLSYWLYHGILHGLDQVCGDAKRNLEAKNVSMGFEDKTENPQIEQTDPILMEKAMTLIAKLKPHIKEIIKLVSIGWRFTEIGKRLGKSADAVRMAYNRGIASVRSAMEPVQAPEPPSKGWLRRLLSRSVEQFRRYILQSTSKGKTMTNYQQEFETPPQIGSRRPSDIPHIEKSVAHSSHRRNFIDRALTNIALEFGDFWNNRLTKQGRILMTYASSILFAFLVAMSHMTPSFAQTQPFTCTGWMCGPFSVIADNPFWDGITGAQFYLAAFFSAIQVFLVMIFAGIIIWAFYNASKERSIAWPFIVMLLYVVLLVGSNYAGGLTVSPTGGAGGINFGGAGGGAGGGGAAP